MFDQVVDEPRLSAWWGLEAGRPEPSPLLREMRSRWPSGTPSRSTRSGSTSTADGDDSVAWHGDRHRHVVTNPVIAIVSVGAPRPLRLRRRRGAAAGPERLLSHSWSLGNGDLFVMGGACQHDWEHCVPKVRATTGPRLSITFRSV
jgi:hypothetical protein